MSRGGFRGRGRGRGGGGAPAFGARDSLELTKGPLPYSGMLYPPLDATQVATLADPTDFEEMIMKATMELDEAFRKGLPGITYPDNPTPWRLKDTRKTVGIEIETWSDRQRPQAVQAGPSKLEPGVLHMDERFFPPGLWREFVEGPKEMNGKAAGKAGKRKRQVLSDDDEDKPDIDGDKSDAASSVEEDFDFEDDDSEHQDYEANYFDNGEGEDDESGGGSDEGGFDND